MESVTRVVPKDDFSLELWFDDGTHRLFDAKPYLERGVFTRLALEQGQPLGKGRFLDQVEQMIGRRCEVRLRGRPRKMVLPDETRQKQQVLPV